MKLGSRTPEQLEAQIAAFKASLPVGWENLPSASDFASTLQRKGWQAHLRELNDELSAAIHPATLPLERSANYILKRVTDVIGGIVGLIVHAPVIAFFGAMVWLESRGPIFYKQMRVGANGRNFLIVKIRSFKLNTEPNDAQWALKNDPRMLRVGAFMRAWNIDELPQFWNVLKGEMSLVGPRPERPELLSQFKHEIPHYNARLQAKPGMIGLPAVKGLRGDTNLLERIRASIWYLENWSLWLDIKILFSSVLHRKRAV